MPRGRLEEVNCAICMDSLFGGHDDLDETLHIATPDCGHVFHEKCLLTWFNTQSAQWITARRNALAAAGVGFREPTVSDAPVECPTCRKECFANPDTGEPSVHRLFINLGGESSDAGNTNQINSSPASVHRKNKGKEKEAMGMARRARDLEEQVKGLNGESRHFDVLSVTQRAEALQDDMVSDKALSAVKAYVGGLNTAITNLRSTLITHPAIPALEAELGGLRREKQELQTRLTDLIRVTIPNEVRKATEEERSKGERKAKKQVEESDLIRRELEREQVSRRVARKALEDSEKETKRKLAKMQEQLGKEEADREAMAATLHERNKLLKMYQAKAESRKSYKEENEKLRVDLAALQDQVRTSGSPRLSRAGESSASRKPIEIFQLSSDSLISPLQTSDPFRGGSRFEDDSLLVDMPQDSSIEIIPSSPQPRGQAGPSRHPTARTFSFDYDGNMSHIDDVSKRRKMEKSKSKYFSCGAEKENRRYGSHSDIMISASTSASPSSPPEPSVQRTNPFTTTREASESKKKLGKWPVEIIDLADSPERNRALQPRNNRSIPVPKSPASSASSNTRIPEIWVGNSLKSSVVVQTPRGIVDRLGIADKNGRPTKGVVSGTKLKRRA